MKVAFSGSRHGMAGAQRLRFGDGITRLQPTEFHHGCCDGSDEEAVVIVSVHCPDCKIVAHPPDNPALLSRKALELSDEVRPAKPYLVRDANIVDEGEDVLIATPNGPERLRSGTWYTCRIARKRGRRIIVVMPDGTDVRERCT